MGVTREEGIDIEAVSPETVADPPARTACTAPAAPVEDDVTVSRDSSGSVLDSVPHDGAMSLGVGRRDVRWIVSKIYIELTADNLYVGYPIAN